MHELDAELELDMKLGVEMKLKLETRLKLVVRRREGGKYEILGCSSAFPYTMPLLQARILLSLLCNLWLDLR